MRVKILAEDVANKIAAGEVVERPASVVKELLENSIDAESSEIVVEVKSGGKELIRVVDNGIGMERDEALLAVQRHATSKIESIEDLFQINTFGFRGEALPSIASVSHFELVTKSANCLEATKVEIDGGVLKNVQTTGSPVGTRASISDLFYNTPARLKFLKGETTELNHIIDRVTWSAMAHPHIRFKFSHNGKNLIDLPICQNIMERISLIYGQEFVQNLLKFSADFPVLKIDCFVGNPNLTKPNRSYQLFFLNRRPIRSRTLSAALNEAMSALIPKERQAVAFLFLNLDPSEVDVNVHPSKLEVRFKNERALYSQVVQTINSGLYRQKYIPQITGDRGQVIGNREQGTENRDEASQSSAFNININSGYFGFEVSNSGFDLSKAPELELLDFDHVILKTQLFDTYIVAEHKDDIIFIDQHVAHERVLYERFTEQFSQRRIPAQGLLMPITREMSAAQLAALKTNESLLRDIGFEVENFGGKSVIIRSIPAVFPQAKAINALIDILEQLNSEKVSLERFEPASIQQKVFIMMACRAAVKAGDKLSAEEVVNLIKDLSQTKLPFNCPHARPIMITMSKSELETRFKRR